MNKKSKKLLLTGGITLAGALLVVATTKLALPKTYGNDNLASKNFNQLYSLNETDVKELERLFAFSNNMKYESRENFKANIEDILNGATINGKRYNPLSIFNDKDISYDMFHEYRATYNSQLTNEFNLLPLYEYVPIYKYLLSIYKGEKNNSPISEFKEIINEIITLDKAEAEANNIVPKLAKLEKLLLQDVNDVYLREIRLAILENNPFDRMMRELNYEYNDYPENTMEEYNQKITKIKANQNIIKKIQKAIIYVLERHYIQDDFTKRSLKRFLTNVSQRIRRSFRNNNNEFQNTSYTYLTFKNSPLIYYNESDTEDNGVFFGYINTRGNFAFRAPFLEIDKLKLEIPSELEYKNHTDGNIHTAEFLNLPSELILTYDNDRNEFNYKVDNKVIFSASMSPNTLRNLSKDLAVYDVKDFEKVLPNFVNEESDDINNYKIKEATGLNYLEYDEVNLESRVKELNEILPEDGKRYLKFDVENIPIKSVYTEEDFNINWFLLRIQVDKKTNFNNYLSSLTDTYFDETYAVRFNGPYESLVTTKKLMSKINSYPYKPDERTRAAEAKNFNLRVNNLYRHFASHPDEDVKQWAEIVYKVYLQDYTRVFESESQDVPSRSFIDATYENIGIKYILFTTLLFQGDVDNRRLQAWNIAQGAKYPKELNWNNIYDDLRGENRFYSKSFSDTAMFKFINKNRQNMVLLKKYNEKPNEIINDIFDETTMENNELIDNEKIIRNDFLEKNNGSRDEMAIKYRAIPLEPKHLNKLFNVSNQFKNVFYNLNMNSSSFTPTRELTDEEYALFNNKDYVLTHVVLNSKNARNVNNSNYVKKDGYNELPIDLEKLNEIKLLPRPVSKANLEDIYNLEKFKEKGVINPQTKLDTFFKDGYLIDNPDGDDYYIYPVFIPREAFITPLTMNNINNYNSASNVDKSDIDYDALLTKYNSFDEVPQVLKDFYLQTRRAFKLASLTSNTIFLNQGDISNKYAFSGKNPILGDIHWFKDRGGDENGNTNSNNESDLTAFKIRGYNADSTWNHQSQRLKFNDLINLEKYYPNNSLTINEINWLEPRDDEKDKNGIPIEELWYNRTKRENESKIEWYKRKEVVVRAFALYEWFNKHKYPFSRIFNFTATPILLSSFRYSKGQELPWEEYSYTVDAKDTSYTKKYEADYGYNTKQIHRRLIDGFKNINEALMKQFDYIYNFTGGINGNSDVILTKTLDLVNTKYMGLNKFNNFNHLHMYGESNSTLSGIINYKNGIGVKSQDFFSPIVSWVDNPNAKTSTSYVPLIEDYVEWGDDYYINAKSKYDLEKTKAEWEKVKDANPPEAKPSQSEYNTAKTNLEKEQEDRRKNEEKYEYYANRDTSGRWGHYIARENYEMMKKYSKAIEENDKKIAKYEKVVSAYENYNENLAKWNKKQKMLNTNIETYTYSSKYTENYLTKMIFNNRYHLYENLRKRTDFVIYKGSDFDATNPYYNYHFQVRGLSQEERVKRDEAINILEAYTNNLGSYYENMNVFDDSFSTKGENYYYCEFENNHFTSTKRVNNSILSSSTTLWSNQANWKHYNSFIRSIPLSTKKRLIDKIYPETKKLNDFKEILPTLKMDNLKFSDSEKPYFDNEKLRNVNYPINNVYLYFNKASKNYFEKRTANEYKKYLDSNFNVYQKSKVPSYMLDNYKETIFWLRNQVEYNDINETNKDKLLKFDKKTRVIIRNYLRDIFDRNVNNSTRDFKRKNFYFSKVSNNRGALLTFKNFNQELQYDNWTNLDDFIYDYLIDKESGIFSEYDRSAPKPKANAGDFMYFNPENSYDYDNNQRNREKNKVNWSSSNKEKNVAKVKYRDEINIYTLLWYFDNNYFFEDFQINKYMDKGYLNKENQSYERDLELLSNDINHKKNPRHYFINENGDIIRLFENWKNGNNLYGTGLSLSEINTETYLPNNLINDIQNLDVNVDIYAYDENIIKTNKDINALIIEINKLLINSKNRTSKNILYKNLNNLIENWNLAHPNNTIEKINDLDYSFDNVDIETFTQQINFEYFNGLKENFQNSFIILNNKKPLPNILTRINSNNINENEGKYYIDENGDFWLIKNSMLNRVVSVDYNNLYVPYMKKISKDIIKNDFEEEFENKRISMNDMVEFFFKNKYFDTEKSNKMRLHYKMVISYHLLRWLFLDNYSSNLNNKFNNTNGGLNQWLNYNLFRSAQADSVLKNINFDLNKLMFNKIDGIINKQNFTYNVMKVPFLDGLLTKILGRYENTNNNDNLDDNVSNIRNKIINNFYVYLTNQLENKFNIRVDKFVYNHQLYQNKTYNNFKIKDVYHYDGILIENNNEFSPSFEKDGVKYKMINNLSAEQLWNQVVNPNDYVKKDEIVIILGDTLDTSNDKFNLKINKSYDLKIINEKLKAFFAQNYYNMDYYKNNSASTNINLYRHKTTLIKLNVLDIVNYTQNISFKYNSKKHGQILFNLKQKQDDLTMWDIYVGDKNKKGATNIVAPDIHIVNSYISPLDTEYNETNKIQDYSIKVKFNKSNKPITGYDLDLSLYDKNLARKSRQNLGFFDINESTNVGNYKVGNNQKLRYDEYIWKTEIAPKDIKFVPEYTISPSEIKKFFADNFDGNNGENITIFRNNLGLYTYINNWIYDFLYLTIDTEAVLKYNRLAFKDYSNYKLKADVIRKTINKFKALVKANSDIAALLTLRNLEIVEPLIVGLEFALKEGEFKKDKEILWLNTKYSYTEAFRSALGYLERSSRNYEEIVSYYAKYIGAENNTTGKITPNDIENLINKVKTTVVANSEVRNVDNKIFKDVILYNVKYSATSALYTNNIIIFNPEDYTITSSNPKLEAYITLYNKVINSNKMKALYKNKAYRNRVISIFDMLFLAMYRVSFGKYPDNSYYLSSEKLTLLYKLNEALRTTKDYEYQFHPGAFKSGLGSFIITPTTPYSKIEPYTKYVDKVNNSSRKGNEPEIDFKRDIFGAKSINTVNRRSFDNYSYVGETSTPYDNNKFTNRLDYEHIRELGEDKEVEKDAYISEFKYTKTNKQDVSSSDYKENFRNKMSQLMEEFTNNPYIFYDYMLKSTSEEIKMFYVALALLNQNGLSILNISEKNEYKIYTYLYQKYNQYIKDNKRYQDNKEELKSIVDNKLGFDLTSGAFYYNGEFRIKRENNTPLKISRVMPYNENVAMMDNIFRKLAKETNKAIKENNFQRIVDITNSLQRFRIITQIKLNSGNNSNKLIFKYKNSQFDKTDSYFLKAFFDANVADSVRSSYKSYATFDAENINIGIFQHNSELTRENFSVIKEWGKHFLTNFLKDIPFIGSIIGSSLETAGEVQQDRIRAERMREEIKQNQGIINLFGEVLNDNEKMYVEKIYQFRDLESKLRDIESKTWNNYTNRWFYTAILKYGIGSLFSSTYNAANNELYYMYFYNYYQSKKLREELDSLGLYRKTDYNKILITFKTENNNYISVEYQAKGTYRFNSFYDKTAFGDIVMGDSYIIPDLQMTPNSNYPKQVGTITVDGKKNYYGPNPTRSGRIGQFFKWIGEKFGGNPDDSEYQAIWERDKIVKTFKEYNLYNLLSGKYNYYVGDIDTTKWSDKMFKNMDVNKVKYKLDDNNEDNLFVDLRVIDTNKDIKVK